MRAEGMSESAVRGRYDSIGVDRPPNPKKESHLERSARRFEAMVVESMVREMWKTIPVSQEESRTPGFSLAQDMYQKELSKELVGAGGFGLARQIVDDVRKGTGLPEIPSPPPDRPAVMSVTV